VLTSPQIAGVAGTEAQSRTAGLDYAVKEYGDVAFGWAMEATTGFCKILAERGTACLLGAHLMGPQASTLIQPLVQAMSLGLDACSMASAQHWIHPALPELVENALLALDV
jgi:mycothione reductase